MFASVARQDDEDNASVEDIVKEQLFPDAQRPPQHFRVAFCLQNSCARVLQKHFSKIQKEVDTAMWSTTTEGESLPQDLFCMTDDVVRALQEVDDRIDEAAVRTHLIHVLSQIVWPLRRSAGLCVATANPLDIRFPPRSSIS